MHCYRQEINASHRHDQLRTIRWQPLGGCRLSYMHSSLAVYCWSSCFARSGSSAASLAVALECVGGAVTVMGCTKRLAKISGS